MGLDAICWGHVVVSAALVAPVEPVPKAALPGRLGLSGRADWSFELGFAAPVVVAVPPKIVLRKAARLVAASLESRTD